MDPDKDHFDYGNFVVLLGYIRALVMDRVPILLDSVKLGSEKTMLLKRADQKVPNCLYRSC